MAKKLKTKSDRKLFLLTNDDGYTAPGLKALIKEIRKLGEVVVVAPGKAVELRAGFTAHGAASPV